MKNIKNEEIEKMIEQKIMKMMEAEAESPEVDEKVESGGTTIHIHHDFSIFLLLYLYLSSNQNEKNHSAHPEMLEDLISQVDRIQQKNKEFYKEITHSKA
ncbi:MAG TPA: hypothetical protein VK085_11320 [Pseudogracilibacillus sp.]|nr:hypothetical protein [Pseudogracilibacillus sp.]